MSELPGMLELSRAVQDGVWPHTTDAEIWADRWLIEVNKHPTMERDRGVMIGWFANAIMAGYDNAWLEKQKQTDE